MSTAMQVFMGGAVRPAHLDNLGAEFGDANIKEKFSLPTLTIAGKKFSMRIGGETNILTKTDAETGEKMNISFVNVVVIDQNPARSRVYFAKAYVPGENQVPACYSSDGRVPDKDVKTPCAATCAACPNSVKGSRIKEGKEGYACESKKRLAIWPEAMLSKKGLDIPPLQLILPITSIWDKENKQNDAEGWFAWDNYLDDLRARGVKYTFEVVTRIKFDNTEHPKLLFKAVRWLDDAAHAQFNEVAQIKAIFNTDDVKKLLNGRLYDEADAVAVEAPVAAPRIAAPVVADDDGFSSAAAAVVTPVVQQPVETAKPKTTRAKPAEPSKPAPVVATAAPSAGLAALAGEWE